MSRTIKQALKSDTIRRALNGLVGCPVGGWGETDQAMRRIADELPIKSERNYVVLDGGSPTVEYYEWLLDQTKTAQAENDREVAS